MNKLDAMALEQHISRTALVRRALDAWVEDHQNSTATNVFGILKPNHLMDALALQQPLRDEW